MSWLRRFGESDTRLGEIATFGAHAPAPNPYTRSAHRYWTSALIAIWTSSRCTGTIVRGLSLVRPYPSRRFRLQPFAFVSRQHGITPWDRA